MTTLPAGATPQSGGIKGPVSAADPPTPPGGAGAPDHLGVGAHMHGGTDAKTAVQARSYEVSSSLSGAGDGAAAHLRLRLRLRRIRRPGDGPSPPAGGRRRPAQPLLGRARPARRAAPGEARRLPGRRRRPRRGRTPSLTPAPAGVVQGGRGGCLGGVRLRARGRDRGLLFGGGGGGGGGWFGRVFSRGGWHRRREPRGAGGGGVDRRGACHELAAAAESGWDFSSRWAGLSSRGAGASTKSCERAAAAAARGRQEAEEGGGGAAGESHSEKKGKGIFCLCEIATTSVVPVDLNAFLHRAELNIARLHHALATGGPEPAARAAPETEDQSPLPPLPLPPPPPLLSLDEIQRRYLSHRRVGSMASWSSSSSSLMEKLTHQGEVGFAADACDGCCGDDPVPGGGEKESLPLSRRTMLFLAAARARAKAMEQTMWDGRSALWRDLLLPTGEQSSSITPACFVPMWAGLPWPVLHDGAGEPTGGVGVGDAPPGVAESGLRLARCVNALRQSGLVLPGGVRTSLEESGQQWDGHNAWPPLQWLLIQGLRRSAEALAPAAGDGVTPACRDRAATATPTVSSTAPAASAPVATPDAPEKVAAETAAGAAAAAARTLASELEGAFLSGALAGWEATGAMMEKYDANDTGKGGGGGEYSLQVGFGWTNGVALDLLAARSSPP